MSASPALRRRRAATGSSLARTWTQLQGRVASLGRESRGSSEHHSSICRTPHVGVAPKQETGRDAAATPPDPPGGARSSCRSVSCSCIRERGATRCNTATVEARNVGARTSKRGGASPERPRAFVGQEHGALRAASARGSSTTRRPCTKLPHRARGSPGRARRHPWAGERCARPSHMRAAADPISFPWSEK
jgi:hypothetical protein